MQIRSVSRIIRLSDGIIDFERVSGPFYFLRILVETIPVGMVWMGSEHCLIDNRGKDDCGASALV